MLPSPHPQIQSSIWASDYAHQLFCCLRLSLNSSCYFLICCWHVPFELGSLRASLVNTPFSRGGGQACLDCPLLCSRQAGTGTAADAFLLPRAP